jgi:hypothetical protein
MGRALRRRWGEVEIFNLLFLKVAAALARLLVCAKVASPPNVLILPASLSLSGLFLKKHPEADFGATWKKT